MAIKVIDNEMSNYPQNPATTGTPTPDPYANTMAALQALKNLYSGGGGAGSAGSPTAYMGQAQQMLGNLDLSGFNALRDSFNKQYATQNEALTNSYNSLLEQLGRSEKESGQQFSKARQTISENSFERGRDLLRSAASRGVAASGLQQLGEVQNRMQTGREVSGVANQYYDTKEQIASTRVQGENQYGTNKRSLSDSLISGLASVAQQEIQYKNAYQQNLASLAMSLQQSRQSQLNAQASASSSNKSALANILMQEAQLKDQKAAGGTIDNAGKIELLSSGNSDTANIRIWADKYTNGDVAMARTQYNTYKNQYDTDVQAEKATTVYQGILADIASKEVYSVRGVQDLIDEAKASGVVLAPEQIDILLYKVGGSNATVGTPANSPYQSGGSTTAWDAYGFQNPLSDGREGR